MKLRPYQEEAVERVRGAYRAGAKSVLFQLPTGGGKTVTAGSILRGSAERGRDAIFFVNRVELVKQTARTLDKLQVRYGVLCPGFTPDWRAPVQVASIDTVKARLARSKIDLSRFKLAGWDECRSIAAAGWAKVKAAMPDALHLGLDATPIRGDGTGLGDFFDAMVCGPTYSELLAMGNLVPFDVVAPGGQQLDLSSVRTKGNDFDKAQVEDILDKPQLVGDVVDHYLARARGKRGITFAVSVKHSKHLADQYNAAGVPAMHLDGEEDTGVRDKAVRDFRAGRILQLVNVGLFTAGFDVPGVEIICDVNPTQSLASALQRWGRGSRPDEDNPAKKVCLLNDHAGNVFRHGLPDSDREWSLETTPKKRRTAARDLDEGEAVGVVNCKGEGCFRIHRSELKECPYCGFARAVDSRKVKEVDGLLVPVTAADIEARQAAEKREVKDARSLGELRRIQTERGYSDGWAEATWGTRKRAAERWGNKRAEAQFDAYARR